MYIHALLSHKEAEEIEKNEVAVKNIDWFDDYKFSIISNNTKSSQNISHTPNNQRSHSKQTSWYNKITVNDKVQFIKDPNIEAIYLGKGKFEYKNKCYTSSGLTKVILHSLGLSTRCDRYRGPDYIIYKGTKIKDL
jgi:hypothetical protein